METPAESTPKAETNARKVCPEVQGFIERVVVPALVKRYIRELQQGKQPNTTGSVGEPKTITQDSRLLLIRPEDGTPHSES